MKFWARVSGERAAGVEGSEGIAEWADELPGEAAGIPEAGTGELVADVGTDDPATGPRCPSAIPLLPAVLDPAVRFPIGVELDIAELSPARSCAIPVVDEPPVSRATVFRPVPADEADEVELSPVRLSEVREFCVRVDIEP